MGGRISLAALAAACLPAACGGGGGSGSGFGYGGSGALGAVQLLAHTPAHEALQVALHATIDLEFDGAMALESFGDEDTWLRVAGTSTNVPGAFARGAGGRVQFAPGQPLLAETDYVFQLSALTCDVDGRILDDTRSFAFRTFDTTPPQVVGADVPENATNVGRTRTFTLTFSETVNAGSVAAPYLYLRDVYGFRYAAATTIAGATVTLDPFIDLPGDRVFHLVATTAVADRAGNTLPATWTRSFRTAEDNVAPSVTSAWPALHQAGVSPLVQPTFAFDESMDPASVEASSLLFEDEYGSVVAFTVDASPDQRTLRLRPVSPLVANRRYTMAFLLGGAAATDVSGNGLAATQARAFTTGSDTVAPAVTASVPADGESRAPGSAVLHVTCSEALDPAWVTAATVMLTAGGQAWAAVVEHPEPAIVRVTPVLALPVNTSCVLTLRGGQDGLHDLAGNVPQAPIVITFTTSGDPADPGVILLPPDGASSVAPSSRVTVVFDAPMDAATLTPATMRVTDDFGAVVDGELTISGGDRVVTFAPAAPLPSLTYHRLTVAGGSTGVRRASGNWLAGDRTSRFRTGSSNDSTPPLVSATVNGIHATRTAGLVVPPSGFTIDVTTSDANSQFVHMGAIEVLLAGPGTAPGAASLLAATTIGYGSLRVAVPADTPLAPGAWTLSVLAQDLSGNTGTSGGMSFTVATPNTMLLPFERTQVVWVRGDLDRDGNGRADFDDDMLRLGLATAGDALGTNASVRRLVFDGILATASRLYGRGSRGQPIDAGSVALRFSARQPFAIAHMQIALGGLDPEGAHTRGYGDESTGVLGRAFYDYRNGNPAERNIAMSPGLGVFPAEMWLYQTRIHVQVWPSYQTVFAQRFRPLCPDMGGIPAGSHALDAAVLSPAFSYATATTPERARWQTIMDAADDWATVMGIILAHEVGHSVGLVAPGPAPGGLFGDASLHDSFAGAAEVMAPSVGYEAMTALDYAFRDVDFAYLRQRILLQ